MKFHSSKIPGGIYYQIKSQNIHHALAAQFLLHLGEGMKESLEYTAENQYIWWWCIEKGEVNWTGKKPISIEKDLN